MRGGHHVRYPDGTLRYVDEAPQAQPDDEIELGEALSEIAIEDEESADEN